MKLLRPYDCPISALLALQELRENGGPFSRNIIRYDWLRRMLTRRERRLSQREQIDAAEQRIKLHLIAERLRS